MDVGQQFGDRITSERILEIVGKLRVSKRNMLLLFCGLYQRINDIPEHMKRLIDIASLFQLLSHNVSMLHPLTPCQINDIELRLPHLHHIVYRC